MSASAKTKRPAIVTVGISASGKSFWSRNFLKDNPNHVEINRDTIREHIFDLDFPGVPFSWATWKNVKSGEKRVTAIHRGMIFSAAASKDVTGVVISDTNLNKKFRNEMLSVLSESFTIEIKYFPCTFELAVERDLGRPNPVGSFVIAKQLASWNEQFSDKVIQDRDLPEAIIVDIDGTLAHHNGKRGIYDLTNVHVDDPDEAVVDMVRNFFDTGLYKIIVLSGRDAMCYNSTRKWLFQNLGFLPDALYMREKGDRRPDVVVKRELFDTHIRDQFYVKFVIDDRPKVVRMWQELGLKTFMVGNPWVEF